MCASRPPLERCGCVVDPNKQEAKKIGDEFLALEKYVNLNYMGERRTKFTFSRVAWYRATAYRVPGSREAGKQTALNCMGDDQNELHESTQSAAGSQQSSHG